MTQKCSYCGKALHDSSDLVCDRAVMKPLPYPLVMNKEPIFEEETKDDIIRALKMDLFHHEQKKRELLIKISALELDVRRLSREYYKIRREI